MELWKRNLFICSVATFIVSMGMSQMAPMLPLYIAEMGIHDVGEIEEWAGIIYGANFISLAIFSPIWGHLSDRYGRKPMCLRASLWLGVIMVGMGLAQSVYQMTALRLAQGAMSGFQAATIPLIAQETPKARSGWALGIFYTFQVSGTLLGPLIGGFLSEIIGYRYTFLVIGFCCFLGFLALTQIHETVKPIPQAAHLSVKESFQKLPNVSIIIGLFGTMLLMQFATMSIQPIITVYIAQMITSQDHIALIAGAVFSSTGVASVLASSRLGSVSDRIGSHKVLFVSLIVAGLSLVPQGLVETPLQLGVLRFVFGLGLAGLLPSINNLVRLNTPSICMGRIFGFNQSAQFIGMFLGSIMGGQIAAAVGIESLFFITAVLLLLNAVWCKVMIVNKIEKGQ